MSKADDKTWGPPWTVLKMLEWSTDFFTKRGFDSPRLDAELMLAHTLGTERIRLYMIFDQPLSPEELEQYRGLVKRRAGGEPVAYLTGDRGFWTIELKCDARALIPRPETEVLVEEALERIGEDDEVVLVDIGTGTGAVGFAILDERSHAKLYATDVSEDALALARENAEALGLTDRVALRKGDLFDALPAEAGPFDMIVSNPPYIGRGDQHLEAAVLEHEPEQALFAGDDGFDVIRRLLPQALARLKPGGWLLFEIGWKQGEEATRLAREAGFDEVSVRRDYSDHPRVVRARKPA